MNLNVGGHSAHQMASHVGEAGDVRKRALEAETEAGVRHSSYMLRFSFGGARAAIDHSETSKLPPTRDVRMGGLLRFTSCQSFLSHSLDDRANENFIPHFRETSVGDFDNSLWGVRIFDEPVALPSSLYV